jgi:protein TonB
MFEHALLESDRAVSQRRRWSTLLSFVLQIAALVVLILVPLFHSEALPWHSNSLPQPMPIYQAPPVEVAAHQVGDSAPSTASAPAVHVIEVPPSIPHHIYTGPDENTDPRPIQIGRDGQGSNPLYALLKGTDTGAVPTHSGPVKRSHLDEGSILVKVMPQYPELAKRAHVQGAVELYARISREGLIENVQVRSGNPLLTDAARDAVRQWRFRPYLLNGTPVEVETTITVNFKLGEN